MPLSDNEVVNEVEAEVLNLLLSTGRVPRIGTVKDTIVPVMEKGVRTGGYLIDIEPLSELSQEDRDARKAPNVSVLRTSTSR